MTLGAREEGERVEVMADCDNAGRRRGGRQGSKRDREGNEVVIRHMQRGNRKQQNERLPGGSAGCQPQGTISVECQARLGNLSGVLEGDRQQ